MNPADIFDSEAFEWFYFLSLALILAFGAITFTGTVLDTERPVVSVVSCSMYPVYGIGDILIVEGQDFEDIEENQIIVYNVPERVEFSVDGNNFVLEKNSPRQNTSVETSMGTVELLRVVPDLNAGRDGDTREEIILSVDGQEVRVEEGNSAGGLEVDMAASQPLPIVHRVVEKREDSLETAGDANTGQLDFESNVRPFQIYGTSFFRIPKVGAAKILVMDLVGYGAGDRPVGLERKYLCR